MELRKRKKKKKKHSQNTRDKKRSVKIIMLKSLKK